MTTTAASAFAHDPCASEDYDTLNAPYSPPMTARRPRLELSPSPQPAVPLKVSPTPSPGRRKPSNRRKKVPPSRGDAVLIHYLGGGRQPDIAATAGEEPLAAYGDEDDAAEEEEDGDEDEDDEDVLSLNSSRSGYTGSPKMTPDPHPVDPADALKSLAMGAITAMACQPADADDSPKIEEARCEALKQEATSPPEVTKQQIQHQQQIQAQSPPPPPQPPPPQQQQQQQQPQLQPLQPRDAGPKPGLAMPISPYTPHGQPDFYSPRLPNASGLRHPSEIVSPGLPTPSTHGELPPIMASPKSETNAHTPQSLPSIRAQLGDQLSDQHYPEKDMGWRRPSFPHSPPGAGGVPRMPMVPGGSPPISPNNSYIHSMPSPAHSMFGPLYTGFYQNNNSGAPPRTSGDYSSAGSNHAETPIADMASTAPSIADRMSIDSVTNPQQGTFVCKVPGCNAPPFQTQYLLNSHANVHSSARPHYCPVKGCPRAEGGKGFKRKNEMIRHGLVHDSPGYVCPFCPDREHKYPRPDNLQRHVRVHHVDKDKDDPLLRDVLSQRPDGPNRGRRRRGAP